MNRLLTSKYKPGGRGPDEYDCWGLVRAARIELFGYPELPSFDWAAPGDFRRISVAYESAKVLQGFYELVVPRPGAIAMAWRGSLCAHVGIVVEVDGRMQVLETDADTGPVLTDIHHFKRRYTSVVFYENQSLRRPAEQHTD